jgi:uncharacterized protein YaaR (DUF327 family)
MPKRKTILAGEYTAQWKAVKKEFETLTGKKKPVEKAKALFITYRKSTGIEAALTAVEKSFIAASKTRNETTVGAIVTAYKQYKKVAGAYITELNKGIEAEQDFEKEDRTTYYRGLKLMKSKLDELEKSIANKIEWEKSALTNDGAALASAKHMVSTVVAAVSRAKVMAQQVKANPTPKVINDFFPTVARDIAQPLGNAQALAKKYPEIDIPKVPEAMALYGRFRAWRDLNDVVDDDADAKTVLAKLKEFLVLVKDADAWTK